MKPFRKQSRSSIISHMTRDKQNALPMARATNNDASSYHLPSPSPSNSHWQQKPQLSELAISCTMNTATGMALAALRQPPDPSIVPALPGAAETDPHDSHLIRSLQSLRSLIFHPQRGSWRSMDPMAYFSPFLNIIQSEDVTAVATSVSLNALLKIIRLNMINERTCGAREAIQALVIAITNCHLEFTDLALEESVLMRILEVLTAVVLSDASFFLTDHAVCTIVISCFQIVQQSNDCNDLFQRSARHSMHELIEVIYSRLPNMKSSDGDPVDSGSEAEKNVPLVSYTAQSMIDTFYFLCSLLNAEEIVDAEVDNVSSDEEVRLFALLLINSVVELGGDNIKDHPGILHIIQDDLFHRLIHHGARSGHSILSMICNIVFSLYHFLRRYLRLQLEAFFIFVLLKNAEGTCGSQLQEVAVEGVVSFCKLPNFIMEMYVNYDCDPIRHNVLEEIVKLLCKTAHPMSSPISSMQIQAFQGLVTIIHSIADGIKIHQALSPEAYVIDDSEFKPFWLERCDVHTDPDSWVEFVRMRKFKKKKIMIAANHYNRNEKKGMEFLNFHRLVPSPPDAKSIAHFFRYTPRLDKNKIGDYLGDPNDFNIMVLREFTHTFEFDGLILDTALRTFLETFRLPGESQKIQRILEAFSERFYDQQTSNIFVNKDAVFILCYSLIMLNTDLHNSQVKKKMTEDEFIKNNRAINGGIDLPREYLLGLFHSISTNAISLNNSSSAVISEMNSNLWTDLMKQSRASEPFILCDYKHKLCREVFISISGLSVATLSIIFEQTDDQDVLQECIEGLFSIARISRYSLDDILDELLCTFCKFTTLLNPYATAEEIVFNFSNEVKPRMATLAVFKIAKKFGNSIRGAWRNLVDCLLKLKRLKLLPPILIETDNSETEASEGHHSKSESRSSVIFPSSNPGSGKHNIPGMVGRFTQLSLETCADLMLNAASEMENNLKIIQQCQIDNLFLDSSQLTQQSLQQLLRALVFAAAGKGQKFSTPVEEEETVGFCWDLIVVIIKVNLHRFSTIWMQFHESLSQVSQFPLFSPCPFAEKAMVALLQLATQMLLKLPSLSDRQPEEMIFKSINLTWKLDKDIVDSCNESVTEATVKILSNYASSVQTSLGWKTLLHLLSVTGRHPKNFDRSVETLIGLMINGEHITKNNYAYFIEAAFGFAALKISPLEKSSQLLDLMAGSVKWIIQWQKSSFHEPGISNLCNNSSSIEKGISKMSSIHVNNLAAMNLFMKLAEALRKTSLVRREEIRNQAVDALGWCFLDVADELEWTAGSYASSFNLVIFAMVDDLHEKMVEYSRREGMEREMRSMEGTLKMALEQMVEVYLCFMVRLAAGPGFRTFWLGLLRRMDTCMKAGLGEEGHPSRVMEELVPELLKRMILEMKEKHVLEKSDESDLWEVTNIQIQWIAPSIKEELFPEN